MALSLKFLRRPPFKKKHSNSVGYASFHILGTDVDYKPFFSSDSR